MSYVKPKTAAKELGIDPKTLRSWANEGRIKVLVGKGGHRIYNLESYVDPTGKYKPKEVPQSQKHKYIYCRVSTFKQKEDLERQVKYLSEKYPNHKVAKDIASGINFNRKSFKRILDETTHGLVEEVVVAHRDRLCRFAFEHFKWFFDRYGVNLVVDNEESKTISSEQELAEDLLSIIHVFSSRHYGQRRKCVKKEVSDEKNTDEEKSGDEDSSEEKEE